IPFDVENRDGKTFVMPREFPAFRETLFDKSQEFLASFGIPAVTQPIVRTEYMVLEMEVRGGSFEIGYQGGPVTLPCPERADSQASTEVRVFVPVFKYADSYTAFEPSFNAFAFQGVALGPNASVKNIYRVRNAEKFPILLTVCLSGDGAGMRRCYQLPRLAAWRGSWAERAYLWTKGRF
ncbi:MAG TPA: hypothetical protein PLI07_06795, partial [Candidatus Hydrogenedentes bacterium]|nr:hypothetical protein [Candidatus Hydrogenedentota bacterium]